LKRCGQGPVEKFAAGSWANRHSSPDEWYAAAGRDAEEPEGDEGAVEAVAAVPAPPEPTPVRFAAVRAVRGFNAPLIYDFIIGERLYLVAFALSERVDGRLILSARNEPLWRPLKALVGKRVVHPFECADAVQLITVMDSIPTYDSGTCFLVSCEDMDAIRELVRLLDPLQIGSSSKH
jgi:hypothetical protein